MKTINLELSIDDTNLILEGLGQLPFIKVYQVIANIQEQARNQLNGHAIQPEVAQGSAPPSINE